MLQRSRARTGAFAYMHSRWTRETLTLASPRRFAHPRRAPSRFRRKDERENAGVGRGSVGQPLLFQWGRSAERDAGKTGRDTAGGTGKHGAVSVPRARDASKKRGGAARNEGVALLVKRGIERGRTRDNGQAE